MKKKKILYSCWWVMQALVLALPFINLWMLSLLIMLCALVNVSCLCNKIYQRIIFFVFGLCSLLLSFLASIFIGFFCVQLNIYSLLLSLVCAIVSFLNYAVTIYNFDAKYKILLLFVFGGHLFIALLLCFWYMLPQC